MGLLILTHAGGGLLVVSHAGAGPAAGTLSLVSRDDASVTLSWTPATGLTAPVVDDLQSRDVTAAGEWTSTGETTSPATVGSLASLNAYQFRVVSTGVGSTAVTSNIISVTTTAEPGSTGSLLDLAPGPDVETVA